MCEANNNDTCGDQDGESRGDFGAVMGGTVSKRDVVISSADNTLVGVDIATFKVERFRFRKPQRHLRNKTARTAATYQPPQKQVKSDNPLCTACIYATIYT